MCTPCIRKGAKKNIWGFHTFLWSSYSVLQLIFVIRTFNIFIIFYTTCEPPTNWDIWSCNNHIPTWHRFFWKRFSCWVGQYILCYCAAYTFKTTLLMGRFLSKVNPAHILKYNSTKLQFSNVTCFMHISFKWCLCMASQPKQCLHLPSPCVWYMLHPSNHHYIMRWVQIMKIIL